MTSDLKTTSHTGSKLNPRIGTTRRSFIFVFLLMPVFGVLGWLSASWLAFSIWGHVVLALGSMGFGLSQLIRPFVLKYWSRSTVTLETALVQTHQPIFRAWVVWLLVALLFVDGIVLFGLSSRRAVCVPTGLLLIALLLGYLAWQTRRGKHIRWLLMPLAGWTFSLLANALPVSPDQGVLLGTINTQLIGIDAKVDLVLSKLDELITGQEDMRVQLAKLNDRVDARDAEIITPIESGEEAPERIPLTEEDRSTYEWLRTRFEALAKEDDREAVLALYEIALRTDDDLGIVKYKAAVDRLYEADAERIFEIRKAEGNRLYFDRQYANAADAFLAASRLRPQDKSVRHRFGDSVINSFSKALIRNDKPQQLRLFALLNEFEAMTVVHDDDAKNRGKFAWALRNAIAFNGSIFPRGNSLFDAIIDEKPDFGNMIIWLDKLRRLAEQYPEDKPVFDGLAAGINIVIDHCGPDFFSRRRIAGGTTRDRFLPTSLHLGTERGNRRLRTKPHSCSCAAKQIASDL